MCQHGKEKKHPAIKDTSLSHHADGAVKWQLRGKEQKREKTKRKKKKTRERNSILHTQRIELLFLCSSWPSLALTAATASR